MQSTIATEPPAIAARTHLARSYAAKGMMVEAAREAEQALQVAQAPRPLEAWDTSSPAPARSKQARALLDRLSALSKSTYVQPIYAARIHAGLVQPDQAFASLEQAFRERSPDLTFLRVDPIWDTIRNDPRFADLVRRVGIPTASGEAR